MTVADYVVAVIAALLSLVWVVGSVFASMVGAFVPAPGRSEVRAAAIGWVSFIAAVAALVYFVGVLWNGDWSWLT